jgi:peroxiredoxin
MKTRRSFLPMIAVAATFAAAAAFAAASTPAPGPGHSHAKIGKPAPDFTLMDAKNKKYTLSSYKKDDRIVVLQWINPGCPVCKRVTSKGPIKKMVKDLNAIDPNVVILTINSTYGTPPADSAAYLEKYGYKVPALSDGDGKIGHMYGAKTTPHMYVIDDYGSALVGTDTIDIYKPNLSMMKDWGVRHIDIEILEWGCYKSSYSLLSGRKHAAPHCWQMYKDLKPKVGA